MTNIHKSAFTIAFYTFISRITGFIRDILVAGFMGAGMLADAFLVAFKLPNFLRRIFGEGAFSAGFIPIFAGKIELEGQEKAKQFASEAISFLLAVLIFVTVIFEIMMPLVILVLAPGFDADPQKYELTIILTRITFPYLIFICIVAVLGGILNSINKFSAFASAPIFMNISMIAGILCFSKFTPTPAHALAIGVILAGITQLAWMIYHCKKHNILPKFTMPKLNDDVKHLLKLTAPVVFSASVMQINVLVDTIIASSIEGAVSFLYYADRIFELPVGMIGVAVGSALLPELSRYFKAEKREQAIYSMNRALELALFFAIPSALAMIAIPDLMVRALFERGAFTHEDSIATAGALAAFALALPAFVAIKIFAPGFYANHDTKTPVKIAVVAIIVNIILSLSLVNYLEHVGVALATAIAGWINAVAMMVMLLKRKIFVPDRKLLLRLSSNLVASIIMFAVLMLTRGYFVEYHPIYQLVILVLLGVTIFMPIALLSNIFRRLLSL